MGVCVDVGDGADVGVGVGVGVGVWVRVGRYRCRCVCKGNVRAGATAVIPAGVQSQAYVRVA